MTTTDNFARLRGYLPAGQLKALEAREKLKSKHIETSWDPELRRKFDSLVRSVLTSRLQGNTPITGQRHEARCLFVVGEAGTGKTASLERLFRTHPVLAQTSAQPSPLLTVVVPAPCTPKALGRKILAPLGYPLARELQEHVIWARIHDQLPLAGTLFIHLDETHNLTDNANVVQIDNIRKTLKTLMVSDWPVGLIISGLPSLIPEMSKLDELRRRGQFVSVPLLRAPDDAPMMEGIISGLAQVVGLDVQPNTPEFAAPRLMHAALYRFGVAIELIHEAIELAVLEEKRLSFDHFATAYADRTGAGASLNPFVSPRWANVDCTRVLPDEAPLEPSQLDNPRRSRKSTRGKAA